ncbi:MAG: type II toxin-antitoxin system RelE/ParE family toxin [Suipraeoptans sp.]
MYRVQTTDIADSQIQQLMIYIAEDSGSNQVALRYMEKIEKTISQLEIFPESGTIPRHLTLRRQGYRVLIVENHLIFYKFNRNEKLVTIYAVVDSRREYQFMI